MPTAVFVPKATISMEEGVIVKWLKIEGEAVAKDDVLFEMETDKALVEVPSPADGVLLRIIASDGPVKVESVVGWIGQPGESVEGAALQPTIVGSVGIPAVLRETRPERARIFGTPAARRRAAELGLNLARVKGTGPGDRITQEDVERAVGKRSTAAVEPKQWLSGRKHLIGRLTTSWQSVPHIHVARLLDAGGLVEAKKSLEGREVSVTDLLLLVVARLLPRFPALSMVWEGDDLVLASEHNLAFAVDTDRGVVAPVILAADALSLEELGRKRCELTEAAQAHRLRPQELQGGVFTLTNLGMQGVDFFAPLISAPQTAILATGRLRQEPVVAGGAVMVDWRMWANLAVDHRVTDGMAAGRFLEQLQADLIRLPKELGAQS